MITSTSLNAHFIAKLVHAANVAIACESYCEVLTSKGKRSVLVEFIHDGLNSSLRFTHASGQDCTGVIWQAVKGFIVLPSEPVQDTAEDLEEVENKSRGFILAYLLSVFIGTLVAFGWVSIGSIGLLCWLP